MSRLDRNVARRLLILILRPAVGFCLRHSLRLSDLIECAKAVFVERAEDQLTKAGKRKNISRMSVMTGVHRKDVLRLIDQGVENNDRDLITKVIGHWQTDKRFTTSTKKPRVLTIGGDDSDFARLCRSVSGDLHPGTVFFELERIGALRKTRGGVQLVIESYVPTGDPEAGFQILSRDEDDLTRTVEHNTLEAKDPPHFHARTAYDNVRPGAVPDLKRWFLREGHEFHARVREVVSQYDQDVNPDPNFKGKGVKVVFSAFSNIEEDSDA